ncbi:unnamed protein product [Mytilus edulis]|uniref:SUEL-type lectin domain-containing protein n=1 Tax=Mytilus edulis TaxID=6550 RepID=A0A8S3T256_MYTED|nr:unnamed protein product [Mytilus edulis]
MESGHNRQYRRLFKTAQQNIVKKINHTARVIRVSDSELESGRYRKLLCENETGSIRCGKGETIRIIRGKYGRSDAVTCWSKEDQLGNCVSEDSLVKIYDLCNRKNNCILTASGGVFGSACSNSSSYLKLNISVKVGTVTVCEGNVTTIDCPDLGRMSIINANYGRRNTVTCPHGLIRHNYCLTKFSVDVLFNVCENKPSCRFDASSVVFSDPCPPTFKYLEAIYRCL